MCKVFNKITITITITITLIRILQFPNLHLLGLVDLGGLQVGVFAPGPLTPPGQTASLHFGLLGGHPQF